MSHINQALFIFFDYHNMKKPRHWPVTNKKTEMFIESVISCSIWTVQRKYVSVPQGNIFYEKIQSTLIRQKPVQSKLNNIKAMKV